jgi:hypothetical protein
MSGGCKQGVSFDRFQLRRRRLLLWGREIQSRISLLEKVVVVLTVLKPMGMGINAVGRCYLRTGKDTVN